MADNETVEGQEESEADETSVEDGVASEESEDEGTEDDSSEGSDKKSSNWKAMSKALRQARKELSELKAGADNGDQSPATVDKADLALFFVENPEAKEHKEAILKALKTYKGIDLEKSWKFVQATAPKESVTKKTAELKFTATNPPKDISKLSEDEALKLSNSQYLKWARATGKIK